MHSGILWPEGKMEGEASGSFDELLKRASEAVRDVDPEINIMVHRVLEQVINGNIKKYGVVVLNRRV
ncbi:arabinogalactan endo-1,4-beta-galactosidase [Cyclobacterium sp. SYSU L10401]|uniref:arabinogalactan endo-1,4-beta-galactosidase n=1 Tax=Cyclobacterium sp. SYSU L10401 TaxID=2678657 RepID=UPI0021D3C96B|nr:arabinogalactan endo-1,4-beta-galactosidase [Cyclobacterium sp. SYSU L10401]